VRRFGLHAWSPLASGSKVAFLIFKAAGGANWCTSGLLQLLFALEASFVAREHT